MKEDKELKKMEKTRLQLYLKKYWVSPLKDKTLLEMSNLFQSKPELHTLSVLSTDTLLLNQFAQRVILSFSAPIFWENIEAYSLVESYLQGESTISSHTESDLLILDFGVNTTPNKMLLPLVNGLISSREQQNKHTLVLCHRPNAELVPQPITISSNQRRRDVI